jgi:hypothetical protein
MKRSSRRRRVRRRKSRLRKVPSFFAPWVMKRANDILMDTVRRATFRSLLLRLRTRRLRELRFIAAVADEHDGAVLLDQAENALVVVHAAVRKANVSSERLRRLYLVGEAPPPHDATSLSTAVAASAAVPCGIAPII